MSDMMRIETIQELHAVLADSSRQPLLLFKHSTRCSTSAKAYRAVEAYLQEEPREDVTYGLVHVIQSRDVSNEAADQLKVRHESPQAILVKDGQAVWHTSHSKITKTALGEALNSH